MVENNPHFISANSTGTLGQITDGIDYPHTGLIKSLSQMARGNIVVKNNSNDFDITQASSGNVIQVSAGSYFRDGKLYTASAANFTTSAFTTTYDKGYHMLVVNSSNALAIRQPTANDRVPAYTAGDTIIALIEYTSATAYGSRLIQFLTTDKTENSINIGYDNSGVYTTTSEITGASGGTTITNTIGDFTIDNQDTNDQIILQLGTDTDATAVVIKDNSGNNKFAVTGDGKTEAKGSLEVGTDLKMSTSSDHAIIENVTSNKDIIFQVNDGGSANTEVMRIDGENSRVGIGTDTPTTQLEVSGDTTISRSADLGQTRTLSIEGARNAAGADYARIDLQNYDSTSGSPATYVGARISAANDADGVDDGSLVLSTANAGTLAERMRIDDEGNIGIGTDTPTALLHLKSGNSLEPRLLIENTHTDDDEPSLVLRKNSPTPNALTNPAQFTDATCDTNHTSGLSDGSSTSVRHITHVANANIVVGLTVTGTGIPSGSTVTIVAINNSTCFTISHDTDATNTNTTLTFESSEIDDIGIIRFEGEDSGGTNTLYAHILAESRYVTHGQEGGKLNFNVMHQGTSRRLFLVQGSSTSSGSVHVNDGQYDVDFIVEGTGDTALIRADAGNDKVGIGISTPKTKLTVEGAITLKEQANADADTAAYGQLWTKTGAGSEPNELYFTNEAGNDIRLTNGATGPLLTGLHSIYIPASAMYPNTSFGCSALTQVELSNGPEIKVLDFATASDEFCQFTISFPKSWNEGTLTYEVYWMGGNTDTGDVVWQLKGVCFDDSDPVDTTFGSPANTTAKAHSGTTNDINRSVSASACTVKNATTDSITFFQLNRDISADSYNADARLLGMKIFYTIDAGNDE